ncbi:MAG: fasciclin domain-containing protein [Porphyromonadaceae bacterium]|nr:fasciclin domain-containing protein [Porphyromonadaceae bacterium]
MSKIKYILLTALILCFIFSSCDSDKILEENLYTFTDKMMGKYLETDSTLTEFYKLMEMTNVNGLLNSYGSYTCFAPTNSAMLEYYKEKGKSSLSDFSPDSLKLIAYDHLINGSEIIFASFLNGRLPDPTMSNRFITITLTPDGAALVNRNSQISEKDIMVHNGVIHKIRKVLDPVRLGIVDVIAKEENFSIFYDALILTGLADSLLLDKDESYEISTTRAKELEDAVVTTIASERYAPLMREYGYTVLMESNETFQKNGINNIDDLKTYAANVYDTMYPADANITNVTDRRNSLNRFIAYHLINKELSYTKFLSNYDTGHQFKTVDLYEYIEPMCPNTLIQVKNERSSGKMNLINTIQDTGKSIEISMSNYDNDATNGVYHEIDRILAYTKEVDAEISSKRLRFDVSSLFPELTNNNMRGRPSNNDVLYRHAIPAGYLERLKCGEATVICYTSPNDKLMNYMGDEIFIAVKPGQLYDLEITTPPIPAGTYEVRFGFQSNGRRGVAQFYVDGIPSGVPVNLNTLGTDIGIGYESIGSNPADLFGYENDKMMRNRGYMKGPGSFKSINSSWYTGESARHNAGNLRKILGTYSFLNTENHIIGVKGLSSGQFQIDFIEFVPTSVLEFEDIY